MLLGLGAVVALGLLITSGDAEPAGGAPVVVAPTTSSVSAPARAPAVKRRSRTAQPVAVVQTRRAEPTAPAVSAAAVSAPAASAAVVHAPDVDARAVSAPVASAADARAASSEVSALSRLVELVPPEPPPAERPDELDEKPPGRASRPENGNGAAIARAIADAKRAAVRECFERELKQQPKLAGTVVVELELAAPDRVEALRVSDDLQRPAFTRCVTAAMQTVRFAALDEDVSVRVPYALSPTLR